MQDQLRRRLVEHFETMFRVALKLQEVGLNQSLPPALQTLDLSSEFTAQQCKAYGLVDIARKEAQLQIANTHHALKEVQNSLGLKRLLIKVRRTQGHGYERSQRSQTAIKKAEAVVKRHQAAYRRSWDAMASLGVPVGVDTEAGNLQVLRDEDLQSLELYIDEPARNNLP